MQRFHAALSISARRAWRSVEGSNPRSVAAGHGLAIRPLTVSGNTPYSRWYAGYGAGLQLSGMLGGSAAPRCMCPLRPRVAFAGYGQAGGGPGPPLEKREMEEWGWKWPGIRSPVGDVYIISNCMLNTKNHVVSSVLRSMIRRHTAATCMASQAVLIALSSIVSALLIAHPGSFSLI